MGVNKIVLGDETKIDLTSDTVTSDTLLSGVTAHSASGDVITGSVITHNVIDNLTSTSSDDALSAYQGKLLNDNKMDKANPSGTGSFSLNRKSGTNIGPLSVAVGNSCSAEGWFAHAEGNGTYADGASSHAEGAWSKANNEDAHAEGLYTIAEGECQHTQGKYNITDTTSAFIIGNGTSNTKRSNAHTVDWNGNAWYAGTITDGSGNKLSDKQDKLTAGTNITISSDNVISATGGGTTSEYGTSAEFEQEKNTYPPGTVYYITDDYQEDGFLGGSYVTVYTDKTSLIGTTVTLTNGTVIMSKVLTNSLSLNFNIMQTGTWTVSYNDVSFTFDMPYFGEYKIDLVPFGYEGWLDSANITDTFGSLDNVLASEKTVRELITKHSSVDYLVNWLSNDSVIKTKILNDFNIAKWVNLRDYALDSLLAVESIKSTVDEIELYGYGEVGWVGKVPTMTSDTAPYGTASTSSYWVNDQGTSRSYAYAAFVGSSMQWTSAKNVTAAWVQYKFLVPTICNRVSFTATDNRLPKTFDVQVSNDGNTFITLASFENNAEYNVLHTFKFECDTPYLYWRLNVKTNYGNIYSGCQYLQFYAFEPLGNVPVMTSNTAPYGTAGDSSATSGYEAYNAFNSSKSGWISTTTSNAWLTYTFVNPICVKNVKIQPYVNGSTRIKTYKIQACNDNSSWVDIYSGTMQQYTSVTYVDVNIDNSDYYLYYRILCLTAYSSSLSLGLKELQFYGRELSVSVPTMTSNTAPWGEASSSSIYGSGYDAYGAFSASEGTGTGNSWASKVESNPWIQYKFTRKMSLRLLELYVTNSSFTSANISVLASNNGYAWETIQDITSPVGAKRGFLTIDTDDSYKYYRLYFNTNNYNTYSQMSRIQFYGLDYSEREFEEDSTIKYIYDHGLELETVTSDGYGQSNAGAVHPIVKNSDNIIFENTSTTVSAAGSHCLGGTDTTINLSNYSLVKADIDILTSTTINSLVCAGESKTITDSSIIAHGSISVGTNLFYCDISNINANEYVFIRIFCYNGSAYGLTKLKLKELWLE